MKGIPHTNKRFSTFIFSSVINAQDIKPMFEQMVKCVKAQLISDNESFPKRVNFLNGKTSMVMKMLVRMRKKIARVEYTQGKKTGKFFWDPKSRSRFWEVRRQYAIFSANGDGWRIRQFKQTNRKY